jgi:hypothetical protein
MTPPATPLPSLGRPPHNPRRTVNGDMALAPSRVWFPGRRGNQTCRGAHPSFGREVSGVRLTRAALPRLCGGEPMTALRGVQQQPAERRQGATLMGALTSSVSLLSKRGGLPSMSEEEMR